MQVAAPPTAPVNSAVHDTAGTWTYPSGPVMERFYPDKAIHDHVGGSATIYCTLAADGPLTACDILNETPAGYGFGEATANAFLQYCHVNPSTVKGGILPGMQRKFIYLWTLN